MKKKILFLIMLLFMLHITQAQTETKKSENLTLYYGSGANNTKVAGASMGGNIWHYLQFQLDVFKYLNQDMNFYSVNPSEDRSDFLGLSGNVALKIPIHLIPSLDRLEFVQPYILIGYGYGIESIKGEFIKEPDSEGNTGIFSKIRQFDSIGTGIIIWVLPTVGIKVDYRSIKLSEHEKMGFPKRKFNRISLGICF